jgi:diguanylate cyclase (GGDEF)-like protein
LRIGRFLVPLGVYAFSGLLQYLGVKLGLVDGTNAGRLFVFIFLAQGYVFLLLRSQLSLRAKDPALSMTQMVLANVAIGLAYVVNSFAHGMMPMLMALVQIYSAFILSPSDCRRLGWGCVATLICAMLVGSWRDGGLHISTIDLFLVALGGVVLPVIGHLTGQLSAMRFRLRVQKNELQVALDKVRLLASHDELTRLPNRRHVLELLALEERKTTRGTTFPCVGLIDIDHFKRVNDTLGHPAGDETLRQFSRVLSSALRPDDVLARWGGEEFLVLLRSTPLDEGTLVMERLRERCADPAQWASHPHLQVTFSAGLTAHVAGEPTQTAIARADAALYQAKAAGRNRITVA